jgi:hypothetical protein
MRPRITNISTQTFDVHSIGFESAGALGFVNEYSGSAVTPAPYIAFAELEHRTSLIVILTLQEVHREACSRR